MDTGARAGAEAVNWLLKHRYAQTRVEAVMVGNDLMDAGHFHHVADKTDYVGTHPPPARAAAAAREREE